MILLTGATGFVGRGLPAYFGARGAEVRSVVRKPGRSSDVVIGDIGPNTDWSAALSGVDVVIHLAARVHVMKDTAADPQGAFDSVNVGGSLALARQAAAAGVRRLVYVSSIKVNGEGTRSGRPYRSGDMPNPVDPYGRSKWKAETALQRFALESGLELVIVRPPLVYGPGVGGNFLALIRLVDRGIPLPFGAITNQRSMIGLENLHSVLLAAARHARAPGRTFLVADGQDISTPGLVRLIGKALGRVPLLVPVPPMLIEGLGVITGKRAAVQRLLSSLQVEIGETRSALDWSPAASVEEGVAAAVAGYRSRER